MKLRLLAFLLLLSVASEAQRRLRSKYEWVGSVGASAFLGDLGGADRTGSNFIRDYEISTTRSALGLGFRRRLTSNTSAKANLFYGYVNGSDRHTNEIYRENRNLSFRSPIIELSAQYEFFFVREREGSLYKLKKTRGLKRLNLQIFGFAGGGVFYFNPQTRYQGKWVNLQPLGTEGQGLPGEPKKYNRVSPTLLYGIGVKYGLSRKNAIGLEFGFRKTFTDYIDDVSTVYYNTALLRSERGDLAADLADPAINKGWTGPNADGSGAKRGDPKQKDSFAFLSVTYHYKILYKRKTRSKF